MKKVLVAIAALLVTASAYAQATLGTVNLANKISSADNPVVAPISFMDNAAEGPGIDTTATWSAQLYQVNGTTLTALTPVATFRSAGGGLYLSAATVEIPGTSPGPQATPITLRLRAYDGASYETSARRGESADFTQSTLGGGTLPPENLVNMNGLGFSVPRVVPEPASIALALVGAGALFIRRRK
jgi:hypothetical protein